MSFNLREKEVEYVTFKCARWDCMHKSPMMDFLRPELWKCPGGHINYQVIRKRDWGDGAVDWDYTTTATLQIIFIGACFNERNKNLNQ